MLSPTLEFVLSPKYGRIEIAITVTPVYKIDSDPVGWVGTSQFAIHQYVGLSKSNDKR